VAGPTRLELAIRLIKMVENLEGRFTMGDRYKDVDKTTNSEAIIPMPTVTIKRTDTETGESATGTGWTYDEAREKAQEKLDKGEGKK